MKEDDKGGARTMGEPVQIDEVAVGGVPAFAPVIGERPRAQKWPDGLGVATGKPERGAIARERRRQWMMCGLSLLCRLSMSGAGEA